MQNVVFTLFLHNKNTVHSSPHGRELSSGSFTCILAPSRGIQRVPAVCSHLPTARLLEGVQGLTGRCDLRCSAATATCRPAMCVMTSWSFRRVRWPGDCLLLKLDDIPFKAERTVSLLLLLGIFVWWTSLILMIKHLNVYLLCCPIQSPEVMKESVGIGNVVCNVRNPRVRKLKNINTSRNGINCWLLLQFLVIWGNCIYCSFV